MTTCAVEMRGEFALTSAVVTLQGSRQIVRPPPTRHLTLEVGHAR
jgi:hypothetical protein